ncbi:MAG TPA: glycosyltransferase family 2 protein [Actinomycetota bacterium]|nr:glycosyltransferase family 2 protein [Actinomycetota bacterium]
MRIGAAGSLCYAAATGSGTGEGRTSIAASSSVFIVIPAYNEQATLGPVLDEVLAACPGAQVVVVDDGSADQTYEVAFSRPVHLLRHVVNLGQGAALKTGVDYALSRGARVVVTFDADGQMSATDIPLLADPVLAGQCEVALGTRFAGVRAEGMGTIRRLVLWAAVRFTRMTSRIPVTDAHNGFRVLSRKAAEQIEITQNRMAHASEILNEIARLKLPWIEVPVFIRYTEHSKRKGQSSLAAVDILFDLFSRPRR